jgi:hypothetical protein
LPSIHSAKYVPNFKYEYKESYITLPKNSNPDVNYIQGSKENFGIVSSLKQKYATFWQYTGNHIDFSKSYTYQTTYPVPPVTEIKNFSSK